MVTLALKDDRRPVYKASLTLHVIYTRMCAFSLSSAAVLLLSQRRYTAILPPSTSSSAIAETALQGGLVMAKSGRLELGDNIYGHYRSIFKH